MIYKNTTPIALYGADADNFLESCGIELYEDSIAIGESLFDGYDGECLLNENGIFLYEDGIVLEGEQAEAYKARKAKEKEEEAKKYDKYDSNLASDLDPLKGKRARNNVGNQASLKQLSFSKDSLRNYSNTRFNDGVRKDMANDIVERDRLSRKGAYAGKGMEISKDDKGRPTSWHVPEKSGSSYNHNRLYGDDFGEKNGRIAHNAAKDAANRHLRRHTRYVKESTIFDSIKIV